SILAPRLCHGALRYRESSTELDERVRLPGLWKRSFSSAGRFLRNDRNKTGSAVTVGRRSDELPCRVVPYVRRLHENHRSNGFLPHIDLERGPGCLVYIAQLRPRFIFPRAGQQRTSSKIIRRVAADRRARPRLQDRPGISGDAGAATPDTS